ncbi:GPI inositol-deacylase isoform X2 [Pelobates fuscus]|uniref:GPI inositol-deacylase isoform X2 n=1 Tax=Pelobates fuscus TaxID=191477 RepID=UPI002FE45773
MKLPSALFNGILLLLVALGVRDVAIVYESDRCSMTYMFEYPEFQKIKLPKKVSRLYPMYELYLYGEGAYALENKNLTLTGIPVLFLPGNAGSYKQARSVGSIALRKAETIGNVYHFNVFTVNFNEELVALYGGSLQRQTKFVHTCIKAIIQLYKNQAYSPQGVAIIAHSMGGLVARALLTLNNFKPELINLIITQATPHVLPVLSVDYYLTDFYALVNNYWILNADKLQNITTLSVAGGFRDYQVRSGLAFLPASKVYNSALSVVSSAVPRTWASTDHLSIVWCKELILATTRALFDLVDEDTRQITNNLQKRMSVLRHHFVRHPAKFFESNHETTVSLPESALWISVSDSTWKHKVTNFTNSWIFGCNDNVSPNCLQVEDLTWKGELLPTAKAVTVKLEDYSTFSHFILSLSNTNDTKFSLECEFLNEVSRMVQSPVTHVLSFGLSTSHIKVNSSGLLHMVQLQEFSKIYQAFDIIIQRNCTELAERKSSIYKFHVPWSHDDIIRTSSDDEPLKISAKLHAAQPEHCTDVITLTLYSSADCYYEVTIYTSFLQILGQIIRFYGPSLPVYILSNLLLAYGGQLHSLLSNGHSLEFDSSLDAAAKPYKVDPIVNLCRFLLSYTWFQNIWDGFLLPELDAVQLYSLGYLFPLASLFLFLFGTGISYWSGILFKSTIRVLSSLWIAFKRQSEPYDESSFITPQIFLIATLFAFICWTTCGAFSVFLVFFHYLLKVVKLYSLVRVHRSTVSKWQKDGDDKSTDVPQNESAKLMAFTTGNSSRPEQFTSNVSQQYSTSNMNTAADSLKMHIAIMNLLLWVTLLSLPSFVYWARNLRYNIQLDPDPNRIQALILIFTVEILMNSNTSILKSSMLLKTAAHIQLPLSIVTVAFGPLHLYRVSYFITFSLFVHVLCCFV